MDLVLLYTSVQNLQGNVLKPKRRLIQLLVQYEGKYTVNRVKDIMLRLYKCIVWPQLEYYVQVVIAINRTWKN